MLHAALAGLILALIYKLLDKKYQKLDEFHAEIGWWQAFAIVIVSSVVLWLFNMFVLSYELTPGFALLGYVFYLLIPFLVIKLMLDYNATKALLYSIFVPIIVVICEIPFAALAASNS
ncbi:hypothetical protein HG263_07290 [Pseudoalteromonas sp. JBTF-M23]|uniref:Uncharacterized protein n=1 Tax=Pseudoalteromonas caenipelagi TaxID=2726988 RepID=A0A849VAN9_9GAMM|nr:hypothetical protein [Pseudoalteromonas caenipelagi]NOU50346.1 hypothetical protein [Pseudoalteromonas caenipelagi]